MGFAVRIVEARTLYANGLVIEHDGSPDPTMVLPFRDERTKFAAPLNPSEVFVAGSKGSLAICRASDGQVVRRATAEDRVSNAHVLGDGQRILILDQSMIWVWRSDPLELEFRFNARIRRDGSWYLHHHPVPEQNDAETVERWREERRQQNIERLCLNEPFFDTEDGRLLIGHYDEFFSRPGIAYGVYRIDPDNWSVEPIILPASQVGVRNVFRHFSPSGRYAVRSDYTSLPYSTGRSGLGQLLRLGQRQGSDAHRDSKPDGKMRFGQTLEIWDLSDTPRIVERPVVRMIEHRHIRKTTMYMDGCGKAEQLTELAREIESIRDRPQGQEELTRFVDHARSRLTRCLHETVQRVYWEPDERAIWVQFRPTILRRVTLDGHVSPLIAFARWSADEDPLDGKQSISGSPALEIMPDGQIRFGCHVDGFVSFDPSIANSGSDDVVVVGRHEDRYVAAVDYRPSFDQFVNRTAIVAVALDEFSESGVNRALTSLIELVETRLQDLIWDTDLRLNFEYQGGLLGEATVFGRILDQSLPVTQLLRKLLLAYLDRVGSGEGRQPWSDGDEGIAGLGYAMRTLVLLDPEALDVLRLYVLKRDGEHESYCGDVIVPEFVARHGWRDQTTLGFGVFFAINRMLGGLGPGEMIWSAYGLLDAASNMISAETFADIILSELAEHGLEPPGSDRDSNAGYYLSTLIAALERSDPFDGSLHQAIQSKVPGPIG